MPRSTDTPCVLAIDLGTSGCKSALCTLDGRVLGWAFQETELLVAAGGLAEQRPGDWWQALVKSARQVLSETSIPRDQIRAICASTQGEGTIPVDAGGRELSNAILWMDMRGAPWISRRARGWLNVAGYDVFKLWRWIRLTGGAPALSGKDPAGHMLFLRETQPELYRRTHKFLNVLDYINLRLTGRLVATVDSILTSWVTDNRNPDQIRYHAGLIAASGIDPDKFPEIVRNTDVIGGLSGTAAEELGLPVGLAVVAGAIDNTAAAIGSGAIADGEAHLYIGTSSWIAAHVRRKKTDVGASVAAVPCAVPGRYLMTAMQTAAGANLSYLKDRILYHKDELLREEHAPDVYKILDRIAARTPAGSRGLIYTPWLYGERTPVDDRSLRAGLFNLSLEHTREDIIRAFLEGVALNTRWMLRPVEKFLGRKLDALSLAGGGGASDVWCQIFADTLGLRIRQLESPVQANALGAAMIAGVGLGLMTFEDAARNVRYRREYEPDARNVAMYHECYARFLEIHARLAPLYRKWNASSARASEEHHGRL